MRIVRYHAGQDELFLRFLRCGLDSFKPFPAMSAMAPVDYSVGDTMDRHWAGHAVQHIADLFSGYSPLK